MIWSQSINMQWEDISMDIQQGSEEWFLQKLGKISGSKISLLLSEGRGGKESLTRKKYKKRSNQ